MKHLLLILASIVSACGQGSNTIYQTLLLDSKLSTATVGPVRNIGQASHQAYIYVHECDSTQATYTIELIGSNINNVATAQPLPQQAEVFSALTLVQGTAIYPYVWVTISITDPSTACQYDVYYGGSVQGFTPVNNNNQLGFTAFGTGAGPGTLALATPGGTARGIFVYNYSLSVAGAAGTVSLSCGGGAVRTYTLGVGQQVTTQSTSTPMVVCANGGTLSLVVAGAGTQVSYFVYGTSGIQTTQPHLY